MSEKISGKRESGAENSDYLADKWKEDLTSSVAGYLSGVEAGAVDLSRLADIIYESGILNHVAPDDADVIRAHVKRGEEVFNRDDPRLYERIYYAAAYILQSLGHTLVQGHLTRAMLKGFREALLTGKIDNDLESQITVLEAIQEKTQETYVEMTTSRLELMSVGQEIHITRGNVIRAVIDGYTGEGQIVLRALSQNDHYNLYEIAPHCVIDPAELRDLIK